MNRNLLLNNTFLHVAFCVFVFMFFMAGMISNARPFTEVVPRGLLVFGFFLLGIYAGRALFRFSFQPFKVVRFVISAISLTIVLSLAMSLGSLVFPIRESLLTRALLCFPVIVVLELFGFCISMARKMLHDQVQDLQIKEAQKESEVTLLQSQLNPHFLFNTLNNIYGVSVSEPKSIPRLILKLSELLRYSVYNTRHKSVMLSQEVNYIENYLEFEKLRNKDRLVLENDIGEADTGNLKIAPLLLIVFVENAFKHAKHSSSDMIHVRVALSVQEKEVRFHVANSLSAKQWDPDSPDEFSGVGLDNVTKRLELLYPLSHSLTRLKKDGFYHVHLKITTH